MEKSWNCAFEFLWEPCIMILMPSADFFQNYLFQIVCSRTLSECHCLDPDEDLHS